MRKEAGVTPYFVLFGLALALFSKRDVRTIAAVRFRRPLFLLAGFAAQLLLALGAGHGWKNTILLELSFVFILYGLWMNRHLPGVVLIFAGAAANFLALLANGGLMPVSPTAMRLAGLSVSVKAFAGSSRHQFMGSTTLWWLSDWIPLPHFVLSPGDLLVGAGLVRFLYASSTKRGSHE